MAKDFGLVIWFGVRHGLDHFTAHRSSNSTSIAPINHRHKKYQPFTLGKKTYIYIEFLCWGFKIALGAPHQKNGPLDNFVEFNRCLTSPTWSRVVLGWNKSNLNFTAWKKKLLNSSDTLMGGGLPGNPTGSSSESSVDVDWPGRMHYNYFWLVLPRDLDLIDLSKCLKLESWPRREKFGITFPEDRCK